MSTIAESASSPAPAVGNPNKRPLEDKADAANTGEQKTKQRSALGGLQGKQLSKMERLHIAEQKKREAQAKKPKTSGDDEKAVGNAKPIQRPLSKLDRELAAKKAKDEQKEKQAEREKKKEERAAKAAMPKKPKSGYICYSNAERPAMKEAHPEADASEMLKLLAQGWKELGEEGQAKWKAEAEADKERYIAECKEAGVEPEVKEAKEDDAKDKHPKKPKAAYFCYAVSERARVQEANPDISAKDVTKLLGEGWKGLSEEDKKQWDAAAEADKERYVKECEEAGVEPELKEEKPKESAPKKEKAPKKKEREAEEHEAAEEDEDTAKPAKKKSKAEKAPVEEKEAAAAEEAGSAKPAKKKPKAEKAPVEEKEAAEEEEEAGSAKEGAKIKKALSSYMLFCAAERPRLQEANPSVKGKDFVALLGAEWKALTADDKKKWEAEAQKDKERYAAECEAAGGVPAGAPKAISNKVDKAKEEEIKAKIEEAKGEMEAADTASAAIKQPKSHKTSLACYKKKQIPIVAGANPELPVEKIVEMMQESFDKLSAEERRPYDEEAEADLLRYQTACEEHKAKKDAAQKAKSEAKRKVDRLERELKDERVRTKEARAAVTAANKAAKEEKAASKKEKEAEKKAKAEKKAAKKAKAAEDMEVEEASSGDAETVKAAIEEAVAEEEEEGSDAEVEEE